MYDTWEAQDAPNTTCSQFFDAQIAQGQPDYDKYSWIILTRLCVILASSVALIANILVIIRRRQYKYPTIFLFMLLEGFYVVSLLSVSTHHAAYNSPPHTTPQSDTDYIIELPYESSTNRSSQLTVQFYYDCLIQANDAYPSAIEGFINLSSYAIAYWLAVCITLYVRHAIENTEKMFLKKELRFIVAVAVLIFLWYLVPFILTFIKGVPFSFGPVGYSFGSHTQLFFYGGLVNRQGPQVQPLVIVWMLLLTVVMVGYHVKLLLFNYQAKKEMLAQLQELNPRQQFIISSGNISILIVIVQFFNVIKFVVSIAVDNDNDGGDPNPFDYVLVVLNIIFDLLAYVLIFMYWWHYYKEGRDLLESEDSQYLLEEPPS